MNILSYLKLILLYFFILFPFLCCTQEKKVPDTLLFDIFTENGIKTIPIKPKDIKKVGINQRLGDTRIELKLSIEHASKLEKITKQNVGRKLIIKTSTDRLYSGEIVEPLIGEIIAFPCSSENEALSIINKLGRVPDYHLKLTPDELQASQKYKELFDDNEWIGKAIHAQSEQDFEKAEYFAKKAIEINPNLASNHQILSSIYYSQGLKRKALEEILVAEKLSKEKNLEQFSGIYLSIADLYAQLKEYEEAILYFKKVLDIHENNTLAHFGIAEVYENLDKPDLALKEYYLVLESGDENFKDKVLGRIRRLESTKQGSNQK